MLIFEAAFCDKMVYCCIFLSYPSVMLEGEVPALLFTLLFISLTLNFGNELSLQSIGGAVGSSSAEIGSGQD